jgi:tetratricopeptide (TPR) repeat protein
MSNSYKDMRKLIRILLALFFSFNAGACIWDAQSMWHEKLRNHDLSKAISGEKPVLEDTNRLRGVIALLEADPQKSDALWLNNLAGAHLRLNEPQAAVALLEPVVEKFPNDYGIHANLGTAYHLLGRYQDAEREIARDLEINPEAHFGLEKYHLALLQYLSRDAKYQARHVYVDEWSRGFLMGSIRYFKTSVSDAVTDDNTNNLAAAEADYAAMLKTNKDEWRASDMLATIVSMDPKPAYRAKWNLADDTNFEQGVIYMAQMNPKEPACFVMLGIAASKTRSYHLAATAFQKAIALGSPQAELLKRKVAELNHYISGSRKQALPGQIAIGSVAVLILYYIYSKIRDRRRARAAARAA